MSTVVEYFTSYDHESAQDLEIRGFSFGSKAKWGRINCEGDQRFGVEKYAAVAVPRNHMVLLANTGPVEISRLIGCPLLVRKYPSDRRWIDDVSGYSNQSVIFVQMNTDPRSQHWGWAPPEWDGPRSVLMVHQDGKDISPKQVEALSDFAQSRLQPLCGGSTGAGPVSETKQEVIDWMTKKKESQDIL